LSSHRFASSIDGSSAPCFNSTLFGDTMAAAWLQKNARWDGFPSSQFGQINSSKRNTLETAFFLIQTSLKILWPKKEVEKERIGEKLGRTAVGPPLGRSDWVGRPTLFRGPVRSCFMCTALFRILSPWEKVGLVNLREKLQKNKRKTIYRNPHLILRSRLDLRAPLPWWRHQYGEGAQRRVHSKP
jgi:hypothetical protein